MPTVAEVRAAHESRERAQDFVALGVAKALGGSLSGEERLFRQMRPRSNHEIVVKAAVAAGRIGDASWAGPLVELRPLAQGFVELLRPLTVFDRLQPRMRKGPFEVSFPRQTAGASVGWLAEGKPAAFSQLAFESVSFAYSKLGGMVAISRELAKLGSPDALATVTADLLATASEFTDKAFLDPASSGVPGEAPPSITHAGPQIAASGADAASFRKDSVALVAAMAAAGAVQFKSPPVWVMTETQRFALDVLDPALVKNGQIGGWDVLTSQVAATSASPPVGEIYLLDPSQITYADGGAEIDGSEEATVQMANPADDPVTASTVVKSLWQNGLAAVKIVRFVNWAVRAGCPAGTLVGAAYGLA